MIESLRRLMRLCLETVTGRARSLRSDRSGAVAVLFALMVIPVLLASGAAVDFTRLEILKRSLQSITDGAALAGASALCLSSATTSPIVVATDYFNKGVSTLATTATVSSPTVTIPSTIEVVVTATASLQYSLMGIIGSGLTVNVAATAQGPAYQLQVTKTGGFSSSSYDSNSIYFYTATSGVALPTSTGSMNLLFTNDSSIDPNYIVDNAAAKTIRIGGNDNVGFALVNKTGGLTAYGKNGYGAAQGSTHYFYSSATVPSASAYSSQGTFHTGTTQNYWFGQACNQTAITGTVTTYVPTASSSCNAHPCTEVNGSIVLNNNLLVASACSSPSTATKTCLQLYNNPLTFSWNDMGGGGDDYDYNDAVYQVSCAPASSNPQPNAVILTN